MYCAGNSTIGPLTETRWQMSGSGGKGQEDNIDIHVTPPDGEEDDEFIPTPAIRMRRKLSTPLSRRSSPTRSLSPLDRTKRRFSTMVSSAAAAAVSRRLSATIGWCLATPTHVKPQIQIVMKRLQRMVETECGEEAVSNSETGVLTALRALCAALERKRPDAFRHVARQATRAPSAMLRSDTALAELALALARRITRENITWSKTEFFVQLEY
ncbi:Buffy [Operophtera brumata]|uniref:Buffy n=1 Tax=Operophtera brumata TaxID=104452 RepID=A0A0L7LTZ9_OPEBR|nr:Buffy [Operophtera brumata]